MMSTSLWRELTCAQKSVTVSTYVDALSARQTRHRRSSRFGDGTGHLRTSSATTTGMRCSCSLGRTRRWNSRRAAGPREAEGVPCPAMTQVTKPQLALNLTTRSLSPRRLVRMTPVRWTIPPAGATWPPNPGNPVRYGWASRERPTRERSTIPPTTSVRDSDLVRDSRLCDAARTGPLRADNSLSDRKQMHAEMTATLSAELDGRVPPGLVDEIVRAILDERLEAHQDPAAEITMLEARQRLERFVRARTSR